MTLHFNSQKTKPCEVCGCDKDKCVCEEGCDSCGA